MLRFVLSPIFILALALNATCAEAQEYPNHTIRFLQGFAPGGTADTITRILSAEMEKTLGQPIINEARTGAGGTLASDVTAKARPDGYTLALLTTGHVISPAIYKSLSFDPIHDFEFISTVTEFPFFIVTNAQSSYKTLQDLIAAARAKPGSVTVGTAGIGTGQHMCSELFATTIGTKFIHVPFRGGQAAVLALLGKNIDFMIDGGTTVFGGIEAGTLTALAVSSAQRWPSLPDVPTIQESGFPGFEVLAWAGVATTKGVPKPIVERINRAIRLAIATPIVSDRLRSLGGIPRGSTPEEMTAKVTDQIKLWKAVAEKAELVKQ
jgi:tripartite-type tricarboxylate transporter receptor subunit TctC